MAADQDMEYPADATQQPQQALPQWDTTGAAAWETEYPIDAPSRHHRHGRRLGDWLHLAAIEVRLVKREQASGATTGRRVPGPLIGRQSTHPMPPSRSNGRSTASNSYSGHRQQEDDTGNPKRD
ncbi:hypothetical protein E2562_037879 [Oryza meyeriana var. granulata]|uniref:Uncharacterized protein n=1 Tax=Oryza meyeriana var. granulata TaxID=110450 RepID=A0A6G1DS82_9ORYZ|nr:hypothetical protein E2562_037879 [Oryza meyeriana var. granulata]